MMPYRMLAKQIIFNTTVAVGLYLAWWSGLVDVLVEYDRIWLSRFIAALSFVGLIVTLRASWSIARLFGNIPPGAMSGVDRFDIWLSSRVSERLGAAEFLRNTVATLGMLGTVIGITMALSHVDADAVGEIERLRGVLAGLTNGAYIAFHTTIVGIIGALVIDTNIRIVDREIDDFRASSVSGS